MKIKMAGLIPPPPQVLDEGELRPIQKAVGTYLAAESLLKRSYSEASQLDRHSGEPVRTLGHLSLTVGRLGRREEAIDLINQAWEKARKMERPRRMIPMSQIFSDELKLAESPNLS